MMNIHKIVVLTSALMALVAVAVGQPQTVNAVVSAGKTANNVYTAIGQPFYLQVSNGNYEVAHSVAQAQLVRMEVNDETCENVAYTDHDFDIPASELSVGTTEYEQYKSNVDAILGYDRLTKLILSVWPTYTSESYMTYHGTLPVIDGSELQDGIDYQVVEGDNVINYSSIHHCDSVVTLHASLCPYTVKDADSNLYYTLVLDQYCWTQNNLKATHYYGDDHEVIPMALVYTNAAYPDAAAMENIFGRLYTWYSAVRIPEGSASTPPLDEQGFVRGICPAGWHLPAVPETEALMGHTTDELHSSDLWISGAGLNTSGFTLLPAGLYKAALNRFEGLLTETRIWKIVTTSSSSIEPAAFCTAYYCGSVLPSPAISPYDGYSVRCVKNY